MIPTSQVYEACSDLFDAYPLAVSAVNHVPNMHSIVLMLRNREEVSFFVLLRIRADGGLTYTLSPWRVDDTVEIVADGGEIPDVAADAVTRGVPIPRDGAMFGWTRHEMVTALIVAYARYMHDSPTPSWFVMPLVGVSEAQWPPFTGERLFGPWFWKYQKTGSIIHLGGLIAANPGTVFWADTYEVLGSDCCVVECDIKTREGHILRSGYYLDAVALRAGAAMSSLADLLLGASKTDLASRL